MNRNRPSFTLLVVLLFALLTAACAPLQFGAANGEPEQQAAPPAGGRKTLYINSERVPCTGAAPMMCLQVRESEDADWQFFYSGIDGFYFVPGYLYELVVQVTPVENAPADGSSLAYALVELVSKRPAYTGEPVSLVGPVWLLRAFGEESMVYYDEATTPVTMIFGADGSVSGQSGCNNFAGSHEDDGSNLTFGPLASTLMMCDEDAMTVEQTFLGALQGTNAYTINGNMLEIVYGGGVLSFEAQEAPVAGDTSSDTVAGGESLPLEWTEWSLVALDESLGVAFDPSVSPVTALFDGMSVGGTSGCNGYGGPYVVDGDTVTFGMMAGTLMACAEPAMAVEQVYLQALASGPAQFVIEGNTLTLTTPNGVLTFTGTPSVAASVTSEAVSSSAPLVGTEWAMVAVDEATGVAFDPATVTVEMLFSDDGSVSGTLGCNNFSGGYTDDGATVTFTPLATTRKLCPDEQMAVEQMLGAALQGSVPYTIEGSVLTMETTSGRLTFEARSIAGTSASSTGAVSVQEPAAAEGAWPLFDTEWYLQAFDAAMGVAFDPAAVEATAFFGVDGTLSGKAGCNRYFGDYSLTGDVITFGALGSTRMMCPEPQMVVERAFLAALQGDAAYRIAGNTLELITESGTLSFIAK